MQNQNQNHAIFTNIQLKMKDAHTLALLKYMRKGGNPKPQKKQPSRKKP